MPINRAKLIGVITAIAITVAGEWALELSLCRKIGGSIRDFGLLCQAPACDVPVFTLQTPETIVVTAGLMLLFVWLPLGLLAYSTVKRWSKPLPPK